MQAQILLNGSPLITSSESKHIALDKLGIRSPDCVPSRTRSSFQGYYYYYYYKPLAEIRTRRVRGRTPRVRASSTANSNEEELENSAAAAGAEEVRLGFTVYGLDLRIFLFLFCELAILILFALQVPQFGAVFVCRKKNVEANWDVWNLLCCCRMFVVLHQGLGLGFSS
jgi:hypothetical protein